MNKSNTFSTSYPLQKMIQIHKKGEPVGIYSICSVNRDVLQAAMYSHKANEDFLLIESTCNQVNQEGGYSGMTPLQFTSYLKNIASEMNFQPERIILGGDHLGPNPWKCENASVAMEKAEKLVCSYVAAGYVKIHLDTSMSCGNEGALAAETIAERSAQLCLQAEKTARENRFAQFPVYVIGTEVPSPGGMTAEQRENCAVTSADFAKETLQTYRKVFSCFGLEEAFQRIIAMVISPGVEFNNKEIFSYDRSKTTTLSKFIETIPGMVFEAHSTDYQTPQLLQQMVKDHFSILKVGPALTFAFREAVFRLAAIEEELSSIDKDCQSQIVAMLLNTMQGEPSHWNQYYSGSEEEVRFELKYSFSDRARYYWGYPEVQKAYQKLITNLKKKSLPLALISQYFPNLYSSVRNGNILSDPSDLIMASINQVLIQYQNACGSIQ
ncbi:MAG: class II D-tagatose-bisphosphate aldolase non-catalytic subunit [Anaerolineaceae bacterium]